MYSRNVFAAEPLLQRYTLAAKGIGVERGYGGLFWGATVRNDHTLLANMFIV